MSAQSTLHPSATRLSATARPMPAPAPVTIAALPAKSGCLMDYLTNGPEHHKTKSWHVVGQFELVHPEVTQHPCHGVRDQLPGHVPGEQTAGARRSGWPQVQDHAAALRGHLAQGAVEFPSAATRLGAEHIPRQAFDVDVQWHGHPGACGSDDHGQMLAASMHIAK